eukprot:snap_masked-scaffold_8-processed-gene-11.3-mRNA-1 protein AED:1.00 eAED:1.00 QI:0/0/0/0/1/1/2/0/525
MKKLRRKLSTENITASFRKRSESFSAARALLTRNNSAKNILEKVSISESNRSLHSRNLTKSFSSLSLGRSQTIKKPLTLNEVGLELHDLGYPLAKKELIHPVKASSQIINLSGGELINKTVFVVCNKIKNKLRFGTGRLSQNKQKFVHVTLGKIRIYSLLQIDFTEDDLDGAFISQDKFDDMFFNKQIKKEHSYLIQRLKNIKCETEKSVKLFFEAPRKTKKYQSKRISKKRTSVSRVSRLTRLRKSRPKIEDEDEPSQKQVSSLLLQTESPNFLNDKRTETIELYFSTEEECKSWLRIFLIEVRNQCLLFEGYYSIFKEATESFSVANCSAEEIEGHMIRLSNQEQMLRSCIDLYALALGSDSIECNSLRKELSKYLNNNIEGKMWLKLSSRFLKSNNKVLKKNLKIRENNYKEINKRLKVFFEKELEYSVVEEDCLDIDQLESDSNLKAENLVFALKSKRISLSEIISKLYFRFGTIPKGFESYLKIESDSILDEIRAELKGDVEVILKYFKKFLFFLFVLEK